jgi:hypothetical protein
MSAKPTQYEVVCSWCGTVIRSHAHDDTERMCLICHARMLNDYFHTLKKRSDEKRHASLVTSKKVA